MTDTLVSIIIPLYNAEEFILFTLESVINQSYRNKEIIVVNDGSTDNSLSVISQYNNRIRIITQKNSGVSAARNNGLVNCKGDYVLFLDADDIINAKFIENKINIIGEHDFAGSKILFYFDKDNIKDENNTSVVENLPEEILFYKKKKVSCPSSYLFKKSFLTDNNIQFNTALSSTADREFLLQIAKKRGKGILDKSMEGALKYRIHESSMSHNFSKRLVDDNAEFYKQINLKGLIPIDIKKKVNKIGKRIVYRSYLKIREIRLGIKYFCFSQLIFGKITKAIRTKTIKQDL